MTRRASSLTLACMLLLIAACGSRSHALVPDRLRIGVLPDRGDRELAAIYSPLFDHLWRCTGLQCELVLAASYSDLLERFQRAEIDLALFGGVTFIMARESVGAVPLVMRDIDVRFRTSFVIRADHPAQRLEDCKDLRFSFGSRLSTSGHMMPRYFLEQRGIVPEAYFAEIRYSGRHDATVQAVGDGAVDLGAANAQIVADLLGRGAAHDRRVRVLWTTPTYADYVWAVQAEMDGSTRNVLLEAFLELSAEREDHVQVLESLGAGSFLPACRSDFGSLAEVMHKQGLAGLR